MNRLKCLYVAAKTQFVVAVNPWIFYMHFKKLFERFLTFSLFILLVGCGSDGSENAQVRILNASIDYGAIDIYFDDQLKQSNVAAGVMSGYLDFSAASKTLKVTRAGNASAILETTANPGKGTKHVYIVYGGDGTLRVNQYSENETEAGSGKTKVRILNASPDAGAVDFFASTSATNLNDLVARNQGIGYGSVTSWLEIDRGTYRAWLTAASDKTDLRLPVPSITLEDKKLLTIVLLPTEGGSLLNAISFNQEGTPTKTENDSARLRLVAGLASGARVAVRSSQGEQLLSNTSPSVSSYVLVPKGATSVTVTANGATFATLNVDFAAGSENTILAYGNASISDGTGGNARAIAYRDINRSPAQSTRAKLRLVNGFAESATPLTISADYSPIVSNVALGTASDYGLVSGGSYSRLDVSEATGGAPLYLSTDTTTLANGAVYSFFMVGSRSSPVGILRKDR
jgi:hypothetical protein